VWLCLSTDSCVYRTLLKSKLALVREPDKSLLVEVKSPKIANFLLHLPPFMNSFFSYELIQPNQDHHTTSENRARRLFPEKVAAAVARTGAVQTDKRRPLMFYFQQPYLLR